MGFPDLAGLGNCLCSLDNIHVMVPFLPLIQKMEPGNLDFYHTSQLIFLAFNLFIFDHKGNPC